MTVRNVVWKQHGPNTIDSSKVLSPGNPFHEPGSGSLVTKPEYQHQPQSPYAGPTSDLHAKPQHLLNHEPESAKRFLHRTKMHLYNSALPNIVSSFPYGAKSIGHNAAHVNVDQEKISIINDPILPKIPSRENSGTSVISTIFLDSIDLYNRNDTNCAGREARIIRQAIKTEQLKIKAQESKANLQRSKISSHDEETTNICNSTGYQFVSKPYDIEKNTQDAFDNADDGEKANTDCEQFLYSSQSKHKRSHKKYKKKKSRSKSEGKNTKRKTKKEKSKSPASTMNQDSPNGNGIKSLDSAKTQQKQLSKSSNSIGLFSLNCQAIKTVPKDLHPCKTKLFQTKSGTTEPRITSSHRIPLQLKSVNSSVKEIEGQALADQDFSVLKHSSDLPLSFLIGPTYNNRPIASNQKVETQKLTKVFLSDKQSAMIYVNGIELPCAPPATPTPDMLDKFEYIPSMCDIRSQRALKMKLEILERQEKAKKLKAKEEKQKQQAIEEKEKTLALKKEQRNQIYALNKLMREMEHKRFREFCLSKGIDPGEKL